MNWDIRRFDVIDSTNKYLLAAAAEGAEQGVVAVANHQTEGRGRRGRVWDSKPGASLCVSILFRPSDDAVVVRYPQAVALSVIDATNIAAGFSAQLKWPNDVVVDGSRKLAGVLAESDQPGTLVVGCGVNLNWQGEMSDSLRETAVSADEIAGHRIDADNYLDVFLTALSERLARPSWIAESYRQRCVTLGKRVRVEMIDGELVGVAKSIAENGTLMVETDDGAVSEVTIGDVVHLRS